MSLAWWQDRDAYSPDDEERVAPPIDCDEPEYCTCPAGALRCCRPVASGRSDIPLGEDAAA